MYGTGTVYTCNTKDFTHIARWYKNIEILIHTVLLPEFGESQTQFSPFPSTLAGHETSTIIPQKNSNSYIFHILKGLHFWSILAKDKGGKTIGTNRESPCK